jgi:hypothetical protein
VHVTPPSPHAVIDDVTHFPVESQQPVVHDDPPQVQPPFWQAWPDEHAPHALPWAPHSDVV